ncbi:NB-ARC domain-containing protein [Trichormus sp. NMC-1]|uniref:NB-ARC domain-containing protein n=1 Tax=Trichormus sp. NMC-1 TaxID=1853259 RepID=UPI0008DC04D6|nr:NB-ARC domain-containing protein [Trichormus sp. NMC-1]
MPRSLRVSHECIEKVKIAVTRNGYPHQRALAHDTGLSLATVSNFLTGKPVSYATFEELCCRLNLDWRQITTTNEEVTSISSTKNIQICKKKPEFQDWGTAVDISAFYGRSQELTQLESWILKDSCRLVALVGMGGVGKTTLATQLTKQIQDQFDYVIWRSVPIIPSFDSMITDLLSFISNHKERKPDINRLMHYLRTRRCLIILDNLDTALDVGNTEYIQLIRIIAETNHQSCLIFSSRYKPAEITVLEFPKLPVCCFRLSGSPEIAFALVQSKRLLGTDKQKYELCHLYGNNPLKIKIVANTITNFFNRHIGRFLEEDTLLVSNYIKRLLEQQLNPLSHIEQKILYWLAINPDLTNIADIEKSIVFTVSKSQLLQAMEELYSRSLIEKKRGKYILLPVLLEYVKDRFK